MLMRTIIALFCTFAAVAAFSQAYKWVDEDGVVHFSDRPREGAEEVELPHVGIEVRQDLIDDIAGVEEIAPIMHNIIESIPAKIGLTRDKISA